MLAGRTGPEGKTLGEALRRLAGVSGTVRAAVRRGDLDTLRAEVCRLPCAEARTARLAIAGIDRAGDMAAATPCIVLFSLLTPLCLLARFFRL